MVEFLPTAVAMALIMFIFGILTAPLAQAAFGGMVLRTQLEKFYQCPNIQNTAIIINDTYIKRVSSAETRLFGKIIIQKALEDIKGRLELYKCASKSEPDTCEYYTTIKYDSMCSVFKQKAEPWYGYLSSTTMPMTCPLVKGVWEMKGVKVGLSSTFPLLDGFWLFKNKCQVKKKKLNCCFIMEMTVSRHFGKRP